MQLEIHILQSFPPANLNRDENGMPKSTVFGGRPRARISSQCQKRAIRLFYQDYSNLAPEQFAARSRSWLPELKKLLVDQGIAEAQAEAAARLALEDGLKLKLDEKTGESKTIVFLGRTEIAAIANILISNWNTIEPALSGDSPQLPAKDPNIAKVIEKALVDTGKPGDVALFGRMMASLPTVNVDAAVQMAHAISVNKLQQEFDFFTAVDDLGSSEDTGADHMGETGYNSSTYYRFSVLDTEQLKRNLGASDEQAASVAMAFAEAFVKAIPTGHQNGFAAHSRPAAVLAVVRQGQPISLVDAFEDPVAPRGGKSLLENAVFKLDEHWAELSKMYGEKSVAFKGIVTRTQLAQQLKHLADCELPAVDELLKDAIAAAFSQGE
ncbi:type I-E CRISPR-associated protein Cas7/Cse4/CasC [Romeria aff. gracilis LEGE 07310]|uniref:Type I-E CRISPR-associated protein Cas7/Cse4/CasC n=1 Tax=Vasconcelosia minhoensis LEGE 07310 TaxID=915328 RepID=A0A8J7AP40_9CYAN|nr:type I-E CRISPR-associated protein Cas7/Cse4/CasC [Romeria gracilis]MBE9077994.1 type I-E CRISPR-associated protein Cas7/Cse4/CasC [Romeria aff. gracilis LEGE 07310]